MSAPATLSGKKIAIATSGICFAVFALCGVYLTYIQPLGPCASTGQGIVLLLGIAAFGVGCLFFLFWVIGLFLGLRRNRRIAQSPLA